jgi:cytochrome o ubiquinol oxidase subunit II
MSVKIALGSRAKIVAVTLAAASLAGCGGVLDPQGPVGESERLILFDSLAIMLAIVIPVIIAIVGFSWWFRASNTKAFYWPEWEFSGRIELIVWSIPALVITFLGGIAWFGSHSLDPFSPLDAKTKPIEVEVVSLDWKWLFIYPDDGVASVNLLTIPAGQQVHFKLTSSGVMNSFFVPQLGSQIYSMFGMTSQLYLQANATGTYDGLSAQFSGEGFADMRFEVHAVTPDDYKKWVADAKSSGAALDRAAYGELVKQSQNVKPTTYSAVEPKLFESIVNGTAPQEPDLVNAPYGQTTPGGGS